MSGVALRRPDKVFCRHCGTKFFTEFTPTGEVGRIEGVRFIQCEPRPFTRWQWARWWMGYYIRVVAEWVEP
jgi:hypothetical protein